MIHTIRKLAREIHRRSVWQVLGAYGLMSWALVEIVQLLSPNVGLPLWTSRGVLVVLLIGLPIVLATSVVQGGLPFLRIRDVADPNDLAGRTPDEVHVIPEMHPMYGIGLFTWRNAVLGGVMAAALLVTSVVSYLAMWTLGFGPFGSLVGQGVLVENDTIVVTGILNRTDDASVAFVAHEALGEALSRSRIVTFVDASELTQGLRDGADDDAGLAPSGKMPELIGREGVKAFVDGEVSRVRGGYEMRARLVLADGTPLAHFQETVLEGEGLELGMVFLSLRLRERIGESLRLIQAERLAARQRTTTSEGGS